MHYVVFYMLDNGYNQDVPTIVGIAHSLLEARDRAIQCSRYEDKRCIGKPLTLEGTTEEWRLLGGVDNWCVVDESGKQPYPNYYIESFA